MLTSKACEYHNQLVSAQDCELLRLNKTSQCRAHMRRLQQGVNSCARSIRTVDGHGRAVYFSITAEIHDSVHVTCLRLASACRRLS
jgi:hypothetical protein